MIEAERRDALRRALHGELASWEGLPERCTPEDFAALSTGSSPPGLGRLAGVSAAFRDYGGHPGLLRVWFDEAEQAILVWVDHPRLSRDSAAVLGELGEADVRLEGRPSRIPGTTQWVWGRRGVTAYVDWAGEIRGFALFAPATSDYYLKALGGSEGVPYRPRRAVE